MYIHTYMYIHMHFNSSHSHKLRTVNLGRTLDFYCYIFQRVFQFSCYYHHFDSTLIYIKSSL